MLINYATVPLLYNHSFNMIYFYDETEGVVSNHRPIKAKTVLATAFMRGLFTHMQYDHLTICGEERSINALRIDENHKDLLQPRIPMTGPTQHIGYITLPLEEEAGWRKQTGWAALFTSGSPERTALFLYEILRPTMTWLLKKKPEIYNNICNARYVSY